MESSESSSSVNNPQMEADPIEVEVDEVDLERMSKDLLRVHVRLIMEGVLTMEESKPVLHRAFGALRRLGHDGASAMLSYDCDRLELLLARREKERSRDRKSGVEGKSVDLGGRRIIKKKKAP